MDERNVVVQRSAAIAGLLRRRRADPCVPGDAFSFEVDAARDGGPSSVYRAKRRSCGKNSLLRAPTTLSGHSLCVLRPLSLALPSFAAFRAPSSA